MSDSPATDRALLVVDVQHDFLPGGSLEVQDGDAILPGIAARMRSDEDALRVATQDWHPPGHVSFASEHEGKEPLDTLEYHGHEQILWPDHCIQGSRGAELHPDLPWDRVAAFVRKGMDPKSDSYSGFRNNWDPDGERPHTGLAGYLRERGIERVAVCGLARDVCCAWTAEDAVREGFETEFLWDLSRSVQPEKDDELRARLKEHGVRILEGSAQPS